MRWQCCAGCLKARAAKRRGFFDSSAILLYLAEKTGRFLGQPADRGELSSWLFFLGTGLGRFSGQAVHFRFAAPDGLDYAVNRYRREAERHYRVRDSQFVGRDYIVGSDYTIVDMSAWGWIDRASRAMKGADDPLAPFPNVKRWYVIAFAERQRCRVRESQCEVVRWRSFGDCGRRRHHTATAKQ